MENRPVPGEKEDATAQVLPAFGSNGVFKHMQIGRALLPSTLEHLVLRERMKHLSGLVSQQKGAQQGGWEPLWFPTSSPKHDLHEIHDDGNGLLSLSFCIAMVFCFAMVAGVFTTATTENVHDGSTIQNWTVQPFVTHRAPDHHDEDVLPFLADNHAEEAIENALKVPSIATFVRAHEGFKRPHDDATIKTRAAPKSWLNFLDRT
jgi:hypothetical protein